MAPSGASPEAWAEIVEDCARAAEWLPGDRSVPEVLGASCLLKPGSRLTVLAAGWWANEASFERLGMRPAASAVVADDETVCLPNG